MRQQEIERPNGQFSVNRLVCNLFSLKRAATGPALWQAVTALIPVSDSAITFQHLCKIVWPALPALEISWLHSFFITILVLNR